MFLTVGRIRETVSKANQILKSVFPCYDIPNIKKISIGKSRTSWATIKRNLRDNHFELRVSDVFNLLNEEHNPQLQLEDTIIHEMIHTIPGCFNHQTKFKAVAALVNSKYKQYHISRCQAMPIGIERESRYEVTCKDCGRVWKFAKKVRILHNIDVCKCPYCKTRHLEITKRP